MEVGVQNKVLNKKDSVETDTGKVKELAKQFESIFYDLVLKSMRSSVQKSGFIDGGNAEEIYRGMLDSEYSKMMSGQGTSGLAASVERQLLDSMGINKDFSNRVKSQEGQKVYGAEALQHQVKKATIDSKG